MAYEDGNNLRTEKNVASDDDNDDGIDDYPKLSRPESPRTTAARYLLDLANFGSKNGSTNTQPQPFQSLTVNTWGHDKSQSYIEECGLPFTSHEMFGSCHTLSDLNTFLASYKLTEEQIALCHAAYQMGRGNIQSSTSSPGTDVDTISAWHHHLIHVLDHSYASMKLLQSFETNTICRSSSINEEASYNSDEGTSSTGSNMTEGDSSLCR